ncbi:MAG TPA: hypothetical protein VNQ55_09530 [Parapedobacter sp.]|nr:hypothetical protein [Parapedobacter sp.]
MEFNFGITLNIIVFIVASGTIWYFCTKLSDIVDFIDAEFKLGSAFGGTLILAVVTNLPEIAIITNGALKGDIGLATGNILGGIAVQSVLLVLFDFASRKQHKPLSTLTSSETSVIQGLFLVAILTVVVIGHQFRNSLLFARTTPPEVLIGVMWILSIFAMKKFQKNNPVPPKDKPKTAFTRTSALIWLIVVSTIVLVFGVLLEATSSAIASHYQINGVIFGATVLALVTSLPEISGGLAFVRNKSYQPIISDIFGGNVFLPVLFIPATLITNDAVLPSAANVNIYLTGVGMLITLIFLSGMLIKSNKRYGGIGADSWIALSAYVIAMIGLFYL